MTSTDVKVTNGVQEFGGGLINQLIGEYVGDVLLEVLLFAFKLTGLCRVIWDIAVLVGNRPFVRESGVTLMRAGYLIVFRETGRLALARDSSERCPMFRRDAVELSVR